MCISNISNKLAENENHMILAQTGRSYIVQFNSMWLDNVKALNIKNIYTKFITYPLV